MPRNRDDNDTEVSITFTKDPTSKGGRSKTQDEQLAAARQVALDNRRRKLKVKLEQRLVDIRSKLPDLGNDQLERVVKEMIQMEDRHRTKLNDLHERMNERLENIQTDLNTIKKATFKEPRAKSIGTLSDVSTLR